MAIFGGPLSGDRIGLMSRRGCRRSRRQAISAAPSGRGIGRLVLHGGLRSRSCEKSRATRCGEVSDDCWCGRYGPLRPPDRFRQDRCSARSGNEKRPRQSIIIVPTVSLALDLERRVQGLAQSEQPVAYHGGLSAEAKRSFADRVASGDQWITVTSPEAACTALAIPLERCAAEGRLDLIVVDEAHIVAGWGDDFRPAFHAFAGFRSRLVEISPHDRAPSTVLLTGTLDSYGYATLKRLFPGNHELFVTDQVTRPEPEWWSAECADEAEKKLRLIEALHHLPRPLLIYTSLHSSSLSTNTRAVEGWLLEAGLRSFRVVDGDTKASGRSKAIEGLRLAGDPTEDLDIVIATSAFGMGVDISDIRAVVHLCVPESVDRLYQEVGRSGRDGFATVSLALWTSADVDVAAQLSEAQLIGVEKAWRRWRSMRLGSSAENKIVVDLTARHDMVRFPSGEANRYWNLHTLSAMDRAGMIRLDWSAPPDVSFDADEDRLEQAWERYRMSARVEVRQGDLGAEATFKRRFQNGRASANEASSASLTSALRVLSGTAECTNDYLARHYRVVDADGSQYPVESLCGGCPWCRANHRLPRLDAADAEPVTSGYLRLDVHPTLKAVAAGGTQMCVWYEGRDDAAETELLKRLARSGIVAFVASSYLGVDLRSLGSSRASWRQHVDEWIQWGRGPWEVPTVLFADTIMNEVSLSRALAKLREQPFGVVLTKADRPDPDNMKQGLREAIVPSIELEGLLRRI
jgi:ATP-dependent DNA helicase RecQ